MTDSSVATRAAICHGDDFRGVFLATDGVLSNMR
jgi:hypothetical protein